MDDYSEPGSIEYSQDDYQQFHEEDSQLKDEYDRPDSDSEDSEGEEEELVGDINVNIKVDAQGNKENEENVVSQCTVDGRAQSKVTEEVKIKGSKTQKRSIPPKKPLSKLPDDLPSFKKKKVDPDELLANINKRLHERKEERREKQAKKEQAAKDCIDENDIFGKMVANELRSLPKRKQSKLKHDINEAIFKYQCEIEQEAIYGESQSQQIQQPQLNQQQKNYLHQQTQQQQPQQQNTYSSFLNLPAHDNLLVFPSGSSTTSHPPSPYASSLRTSLGL